MRETIHVCPTNDTRPHLTEGLGCPCKPRVEEVTHGAVVVGTLIIHNSYDGREHTEQPVKAA